MRSLVIIPARKGSKRFPGKNVTPLNGIPLFLHSVIYAKKFFKHEDIWVNTDDEEIKSMAKSHSFNVYDRNPYLSTDHTKTVDVLKDQLESFERNGLSYEAVILLQPTSPLRKDYFMEQALELFRASERASLATFSLFSKKIGRISEDHFFTPLNYTPGQRSQDLDKTYYENGNIYITSSRSIMNEKVISEDVQPLVIDHPFASVDIDYLEDLQYAEFLMNTISDE